MSVTFTVPSHDIEIDVSCNECGSSLKAYYLTNRSTQWIEVDPCEKCMEAAREEGTAARDPGEEG